MVFSRGNCFVLFCFTFLGVLDREMETTKGQGGACKLIPDAKLVVGERGEGGEGVCIQTGWKDGCFASFACFALVSNCEMASSRSVVWLS